MLGVALNYIKLFTADIRKSELSYEHDRMSEMADIYAENIKKSIKTYIDFTSLATAAISASGEINPSKVHQILQNIVDNTDFLSLSATFNDGSYIMAAEKGLNIPPPVSVQNTHETEMHFKISKTSSLDKPKRSFNRALGLKCNKTAPKSKIIFLYLL